MSLNDEFNKRLVKAVAKMKKGARNGIKLGAALIKAESQRRTPVDTGNLKAGHYTTFQTNGGLISAEVGTTAEYAIYVHEDLEANHKVGEAKFLENAIEAKRNEVAKVIKNQLSL